jgi:RND family efflux transporter MFP subunit
MTRQERRMRTKHQIYPIRTGAKSRTWGSALAALAAIIVCCGGCEKGDDVNAYKPPPAPDVVVANPVDRDVVSYLTFTGVIEASEEVDLRARVQGFLEKVNFEPGQRVKKGDLLFVIDKSQYQAAVDRAEASVQARQAALQGAANDASMARELADQRAGPEIDAVIKAARRDTISGEVAVAKAELENAKLDLSYCEVRAPIDGRITKNLVDEGNLVGRGEPTLLAQIVQDSPAYVSIDANESDVLAVMRDRERRGEAATEPGQMSPGSWRPSELSLADQANYKYKGRVDYVAPEMDKQTGTLRVRTRYDNADGSLLPGLFARVRFPMSNEKALLVPEAALLSDQQGRYALIVNEKNEVEARRVKIGALDGTMRVVTEGLKPEDRVIVLGVLKARPGSTVNPKKQEPSAPAR